MGRICQIVFGVVCVLNLMIWALILWLLGRTVISGADIPCPILTALSLFLLSFFFASIFFQLFMRKKVHALLVLTLVAVVVQFITVLVLSFCLFSDDRKVNHLEENALTYVQGHRWIPLTLAFVFVPIFLIQILYLNQQVQQLQSMASLEQTGGYKRKATPYHGKNDYVSSVVVG
ncbi:unnamed protein product [Bursaphelenchus xylophilus]|uniref:(pine wood nematode) hypothetical protein n=1 Tax=Bursaphelenchus xylophilus TaxID=6326 RepID=A0A1I7RL70_BURXY|nr:unnamed protein product [Bursaphelenchus xylophilus]CAG9083368.1 unnamed protein product [Bursaphelenchus xylophilus]